MTGVQCRACRAFTSSVLQSRHAAEGILRIRRCTKCKLTFRTLETYFSAKHGNLVDDYDAVTSRRSGDIFGTLERRRRR